MSPRPAPRACATASRLCDRLGGLCWLALLALTPFLFAPSVSAQDLGSDGLWWSVGAGFGWNRIGCDVRRGELEAGPVGTVALGTTLRPGLLLGAG